MYYYTIKDGHCLGRFDSEIEAIRYAKRVGAIVESKEE
jgi:hypothetical protein